MRSVPFTAIVVSIGVGLVGFFVRFALDPIGCEVEPPYEYPAGDPA